MAWTGGDVPGELVLDHAEIGVLCIATDGVRYANRYACDKLGYERDELLALDIFDINPTLTAEMWPEHSRRFVGPQRLTFETVHRTKGGASLPVEITVSYVVHHDEPLFVASARDLTEQRLAVAERERLQVQLAQSDRLEALGRLAGGVAHDFNNLLSVILLTAAEMTRTLPEDSPLKQDLDDIHYAAMRSVELTRQLLVFGRRQAIAPTHVDLVRSAESFLRVLQRMVGESFVLELVREASSPIVWIDPGQLDQVLANLILNARDAMGEGGTITIEVRALELDAAQAEPHRVSAGAWAQLIVRDTGHGMSPELIRHAFDPFFTTKGVGKGTGLGLATVFGIASQNGGHVRVESEVGKGSVFFVYLPQAVGSRAPDLELAPIHEEARGSETVLIVEDEPHVLRLSHGVLETLGYQVRTASSGREALDLLAEHGDRIDCLLTDVVMPGLSGVELATQVRARWPRMAIVFMSGYAADAAIDLDDSGYVAKPITRRALATALRHQLDRDRRG